MDIKGPSLAFLPVLAFEGGTRRNIPKFEVCFRVRIMSLFFLLSSIFCVVYNVDGFGEFAT